MSCNYDVVVLGSGIIGLAIAHHLVDRGLRVAVVARDFAEDTTSLGFASPWAGASWQSWAETNAQKRQDTITYNFYLELIKTRPDLVMRTPMQFLYNDSERYPERWYKDLVDDYRLMREDELPPARKHGVSFTAVTVHAPKLIQYLSDALRDKGVKIMRHRAVSLDELYSLVGTVNIVVNASGNGSLSLLGVQDKTVQPRRGQVVVAKAPKVKALICDDTMHLDGTLSRYIIPRPGDEDHVILGGVYEPHRWDPLPEWDTAERILMDAYAWCPDLANGGSSWKDIEIVSHNVGIRPGRDGGMRLEIERRRLGSSAPGLDNASAPDFDLLPKAARRGAGREVAVLHAYGTATGYMSHWGIGSDAADMVVAYLHERMSSSL